MPYAGDDCTGEQLSPLTIEKNGFIQEDIKIIKENVKLYINALIKEAGIV